MKRNKLVVLVIMMIALLCIGMLSFLLFKSDEIYVPYKEFYNDVKSEIVKSVEITDEKVKFKIKSDETIYYTQNPEYDNFKEFLLLNGVEIEKGVGYDDMIYIFDILFYVIFLGATSFGVYKLLSFNKNNFSIIRKNKTKFTDIAGMTELKKDMMKIVEILKEPDEYSKKGIRAPKGIILEGPPGNGKTLFARAIAGEANINFIPTKGADFQSAMMSVGPRKIKTLFKKARRNKPCIIFIDEFDGIGERRNYAGTGIDKENNRLIISMLNEMDGFSNEDGVLVIAATNSYASLDAALVRPGRFDIKYKIGNPDKETVLELINMYTKNKKLDSKVNLDMLSKCLSNLSCAAIETILNEAILIADSNGKETITIQDISEAGKKTGTVNIKICN